MVKNENSTPQPPSLDAAKSFDWSMATKLKNPTEIVISDLTAIIEAHYPFIQDLFSHYARFYPSLNSDLFRFNEVSYWNMLEDFGMLSRRFTPLQAADIYHEVVVLHVPQNNSKITVANYKNADDAFFASMEARNKLLSPSQFICLLIHVAAVMYHIRSGSLASKFRFLIQQMTLKEHILVDNAVDHSCSLKSSITINPNLDTMTALAFRAAHVDRYNVENFVDLDLVSKGKPKVEAAIDKAAAKEAEANLGKQQQYQQDALIDFLELSKDEPDDTLLFEYSLPDTKAVFLQFDTKLKKVFDWYCGRKFDGMATMPKMAVNRLPWKNFLWLVWSKTFILIMLAL